MSNARNLSDIVGGNFNIPVGALGNAPNPIDAGTVVPWAKSSAPTGWLECDGSAVSRSTYAALFTAIGTVYGVGDGSSTFNLPDIRGRVIAGQDDMGGASADRLTAQSGGVNGDTLGGVGGAETHQLTVGELAAHTHTEKIVGSGASNYGGGTARSAPANSNSDTGSTGGDGAHNNVQPTIILNYIIKT